MARLAWFKMALFGGDRPFGACVIRSGMAEVQAGARNRARRRQALLIGGGPSVGMPLSPAPGEPSTWLASREIANSLGDMAALKRTPVPSMDYMCGRNAGGIQGSMVAQAGVLFCVWEG